MSYKPLLRNATSADANDIAKVYLSSRKEFVAYAPLVHTDEDIYRWIRETLLPSEHVIVAEINEIIIGMMSLTSENGMGRIKQLYISPTAVGQGVGTLMIRMAKSILGAIVEFCVRG